MKEPKLNWEKDSGSSLGTLGLAYSIASLPCPHPGQKMSQRLWPGASS